ncbi:MAG TPA: SDR family NAD(P)-dependent oxidoreductase [Waterburya sp.]|jgi:acyl transferase domain-containing protein/acyl carrier protein
MTIEQNGLEIAIIGISGRFPGKGTVDNFWENLKNGSELISVFPNSQSKAVEGRSNGSKSPIKAGAVLDDVEQFDASFFGFNPREAEVMDPQHRLFLECAWEALENAGYDSEREARPIGVYAGVGMSTYSRYNLYPNESLSESIGSLQTLIGIDKDYVPTRVSYKLNLKGPSVSVGTACSSSLVAVHLACQSLLSGECDMALAAGVSVKVPQNELTLSPEGIISPDGQCRAFDAKANGTVGGNGIGVVVLKRLEDALADGDYIYAVIKGSAINNDGALKVGYTAPSEEGQVKVIRAAQVMAEVEPETITYMETHGTGTPLGDPIEIAAMTRAFRATTDKKGYCAIGSVKTNIGHLDAAAGIAGLIKTVLALHHKLLPPSLNFETPNPQIDFANSPFYVNTELSEWKANGTPRRAGVSSFGFGGTNAHVILEEAPPVEAPTPSRSRQLLVLSAKTSSALETATANLAEHLKQHPELNLADVAYTLQVGRRAFEHRRMVIVEDLEDAVKTLESVDPQRVFTQFQESSDRSVVFMFTGQGAQYVNMARELYRSEPTFREECDRCFALLQPHLGIDLRSCLYPTDKDVEKATQQLKQTAIAQPALFVIEYALAKLWMSWGVQPQSMIGHSIGEYVAACLADVFSLEDVLALIATRGRLMQQMPAGAMLSVNLSASEVQPFLDETLSLAASNAPSLSVVSGSMEAVEQLERQLAEKGVEYRCLHTSHAFHSEMMDSVIAPFTEQVKKVNLKVPKIPFVSNVTGTWITATEATDPNYWARHLRQPVRFSEGIAELLQDSQAIFLEVGPGRTLSTLTKQQAIGRVVLSSLRHPKDEQSDVVSVLNALGRLWLAGVEVDWSEFYAHEKRERIPLPTYPFERQRYWLEPPEQLPNNRQGTLDKKPDIADWFYVPSWQRSVLPLAKLTGEQHCWLVFVDSCGLGSAIVQRLEQQGHTVIQVKIGEEFSRVSDNVYTINPGIREHYDALIKEILALEQIPIIAHLWTITPHLSFEESQYLGFYSLLYLAQAIGQQNVSDSLHIGVVSSHIQDVTGAEQICPEKATVLGCCKVIPQEYPNLTCRSIDIVLPESGTSSEDSFIDKLIAEITAESSDSVVAYRGNYRWIPTYEAVRLEKTDHKTPLRQGGVYLITGGMGGIGLAVAEYLAQTVQAKLVLISRSTLPPRDEWQQWLVTHDNQDAIAVKIRKVQALEKLGADVLVLGADVTDEVQMQTVEDRVRQVFGQLHGIFHAAGIAGNGIIQLKNPELAANVMTPKVKGTLVLEQTFKDSKLDFFVLFSSISSFIGGVGQVDYCAANIFLDAFVRYKASKTNCFTTSINWDAWQEIGMGANITDIPNGLKAQHLETLRTGITPNEGVDGLSRILQSGLNQVIVSTKDWQAVLAQKHNLMAASELLDSPKTPSTPPTHTRSLQGTTYVAPTTEIEQQIAELWQEQLGIELVGVNDNFFELGGHSLLAVKIVSRLREIYQVDLPLRTLLSEAPTVAGIAAAITEQLPQQKELDEMAQILAEIENLSLDEVQEQLVWESQSN